MSGAAPPDPNALPLPSFGGSKLFGASKTFAAKTQLASGEPQSVPDSIDLESPGNALQKRIDSLQTEAIQLKRGSSSVQALAKLSEARQLQAEMATIGDPSVAENVINTVMARVERQARQRFT